MKSEKTLVGLGFALISIIWGSTWLAIKIGLDSVPPMYGIALRFTLAFVILLVIMKVRRQKLPTDRESLAVFATLGVLSFSFPYALVYWSEQYIASGLASVLFAIYPFVVAGISHFVLKGERLNGFKLIGIVAGFAGILIIFWDDVHVGGANVVAMGGMLLSSVLQAISLVTVKKRGKHIDPVAMNVGGIMFGLAIMYVLAFFFESINDIHLDAKGWGSIFYLGTFGTVITFVVYYWLLRRVEAVYLSLMALVTPVLAVILGTILLQESLSPRVFSGAALVLTGIMIANGRDVIVAIRTQKEKLFS